MHSGNTQDYLVCIILIKFLLLSCFLNRLITICFKYCLQNFKFVELRKLLICGDIDETTVICNVAISNAHQVAFVAFNNSKC